MQELEITIRNTETNEEITLSKYGIAAFLLNNKTNHCLVKIYKGGNLIYLQNTISQQMPIKFSNGMFYLYLNMPSSDQDVEAAKVLRANGYASYFKNQTK